MKVLQILPSLNVGGVERGVIDLTRAMKRRGEETVVISSGGELVQHLQKMGVTHYTLPVHKKSLFSLSVVPKIAQIIRHEQIDLVHARSRVPAWLAWFAARQTGTPFVTTCHGYYSTHFLSRIMGWGKRVIAISRIVGRHMIDDFGVPPERIRLIHRGVDLSQFEMKSFETNKDEKRVFRIINVGRFSPIKGQVEFLKAIHILRRKIPAIEVLLVGSEGKGKTKYTELIKQTIEQLGLESCVKLLGTRRDIPELLKESDLLVLSTLIPEAFGRVIIEAGAVGVPVLATKVGGVLDIIEEDKNGVLVLAGSPEAMSEGMWKVLSNPEFAKEIALGLNKKVKEEFSLELMVDKELAVYREALSEKKILMVKLGAMGDVILAVPSIRMVRERFPNAFISLVVDKQFAPLLSNVPYLDEVFPVSRGRLPKLLYLLKVAKKIRREGFEISIDLQNSKWTHLLTYFAGVKERYGFSRGKMGFLLNRPDNSHNVVESPVENQFRILSKLGVRKIDGRLELWADPQANEKIEACIDSVVSKENGGLVGFVIGSSAHWTTKRWPIQSFQKLSERLIKEANCRIALIGSNEDAVYMKEAGVNLKDSGYVLDFLGKTSAQELVALVKRLDVIVTGDTAPLHVANAMQVKMVALFGPTDPKKHVQGSGESVILTRNLECQPCYEGSCANQEQLACLKQITVDEVFQAVLSQLPSKKVFS